MPRGGASCDDGVLFLKLPEFLRFCRKTFGEGFRGAAASHPLVSQSCISTQGIISNKVLECVFYSFTMICMMQHLDNKSDSFVTTSLTENIGTRSLLQPLLCLLQYLSAF